MEIPVTFPSNVTRQHGVSSHICQVCRIFYKSCMILRFQLSRLFSVAKDVIDYVFGYVRVSIRLEVRVSKRLITSLCALLPPVLLYCFTLYWPVSLFVYKFFNYFIIYTKFGRGDSFNGIYSLLHSNKSFPWVFTTELFFGIIIYFNATFVFV